MTGANKYVLSIYSKMLGQTLEQSKLDVALRCCNDTLTNQNIRQLTNQGIPIMLMQLFTKQKVIDHILKEVIEFIHIARNLNFRQSTKAINRLRKAIIKSIKI